MQKCKRDANITSEPAHEVNRVHCSALCSNYGMLLPDGSCKSAANVMSYKQHQALVPQRHLQKLVALKSHRLGLIIDGGTPHHILLPCCYSVLPEQLQQPTGCTNCLAFEHGDWETVDRQLVDSTR